MSEEIREALETPVNAASDAEAVTAAAAEAVAPAESMDDYQKELNNSMRRIEAGDLVEGTVSGVSEEDVTVDLQ